MNFLPKSACMLAWSILASAAASAATIDVDVSSFRYTPNSVTIHVGDTVRWTNSGGFHNVRADDGSFGNTASSSLWSFSHTFNSVGEFGYFCQVHSSAGADIATNMNGIVQVLAAEPPPFVINQGLGGSWFNPATGGQGFLIDLLPENKFMFVAWFTYDKAAVPALAPIDAKIGAPDQRWMTASGLYNGKVAPLTLYVTRGGLFNNGQAVTTTPVGTMTLDFTDCSNATITYDIPGEGVSGVIPISRQTTGMAAYCRSLQAAPAATAAE
ncbi:MAG: hypothetical protein KA505_07240 [Xanthomonadales bacterium]|nr:hypothetical protein [Xanthomonadales bacterium]